MKDFYRFPHTPHLAWLGKGLPREDKVLSPEEAHAFFDREVVVEEKVDGANLGFSVDEDGTLKAQNRGAYIDLHAPKQQFKLLQRWLAPRAEALADALFPNLMLFGEWCYAVHSVHYTHLPDWFMAFDVFDRETGRFWNVTRRNALAEAAGIAVVPCLGAGQYDLTALKALLGRSHLADIPAEGLYVRLEDDEHLTHRAKLVRAEFVQAIDEHWSKKRLQTNSLASQRQY